MDKQVDVTERIARSILLGVVNIALFTIIALNISSAENAYNKCKEGETVELQEDLSRLEYTFALVTGYYGAQAGCWLAKRPELQELDK